MPVARIKIPLTFVPNVVRASFGNETWATSVKLEATLKPGSARTLAGFLFSRSLGVNVATRNHQSRRADQRRSHPVKCGKRLRGLANAPQPNELVPGSVTAGQVSAVFPLTFFPTKEGRGAGGMEGLPFLTFRPEPPTTLLGISPRL